MDLGGLTVATLGSSGLLALVVLMILRGDLVPRRTHTAMIQAQQRTIAEQASHIQDQDRQIVQLYRGNATTQQFLGSLPEVIGSAGTGAP